MQRQRLDKVVVLKRLVPTRSQAESWIKLGRVKVNGRVEQKPGLSVSIGATVTLDAKEQYVSRAGLKLASVTGSLKIDFRHAEVLDVGSSTGGFTDYALQHGARKVIAVDVGTEQLHPSLRCEPRVELHEKTDIRDMQLSHAPDIVVIDVSFISLREILPYVAKLSDRHTQIVAMVKPQFEAGKHQANKGVIKNDAIRRQILSEFEQWARQTFVINSKQDSDIAGSKGNKERFYLLQLANNRGK